jgi:ubiquinone/menaquinone biosynthesis C-methylase UbiE
MKDLYRVVLEDLLEKGIVRRDMHILVLCGGKRDHDSLLAAGFSNVTISNVDSRMHGDEYAPFHWSFQDAEKVEYEDESFDFCIAADGLHHCQSPHRALLELYRTARLGLLVLEPRDNLMTRIGVWLGYGQDYEAAAVHGNDGKFGGLRNTELPNYIYRWTEREIEKTINCYAPWGKHQFLYWYKLRIPWLQLRMRRNKARLALMTLAFPFLRLFTWIFPGQSNNFGFAVIKPRIPSDLHPWIVSRGKEMQVNHAWMQQRYGRVDATERSTLSHTL